MFTPISIFISYNDDYTLLIGKTECIIIDNKLGQKVF